MIAFVPAIAVAASAALTVRASSPTVQDETDVAEILSAAEKDQVLRTFFERLDVEEVLAGLALPRPVGAELDVEAAARELGDWNAAYDFVRQAVRYVPYAGTVRGATGTLAAKTGNSLDQSVLLRALLRHCGIETRLVRGRLGWSDAMALIGSIEANGWSASGDPLLRWIELAADHWWLEALRDGRWVALDPSFTAARVGETKGHRAAVVERIPTSLTASVVAEVFQGPIQLARLELPAAEVLGRIVELRAALPTDAAASQEALEEGQVSVEAMARALGDARLPEEPESVSFWLYAGERRAESPVVAVADLDQVLLRVTSRRPLAPDQHVEMPFGRDAHNRVVVVVGAGSIAGSQLARVVGPLFGALKSLASVEAAAYEELFVDREELPAAEIEDPLLGLPAGDPQTELHPADVVQLELSRAWNSFHDNAPTAVAWAFLRAIDEMSSATASADAFVRPGFRMVALGWRSPARNTAGQMTVRVLDPIVVLGATRADTAGLQSAYGILQSAVLSHILHFTADRAPATAFDATMRAFGTGSGLEWWRRGAQAQAPPGWPIAAGADVAERLQRGYAVAGMPQALESEAGRVLGWWQVAPHGGETHGWVDTVRGPAQGVVMFAEPFDFLDLDSTLGSAHDLQHAVHWLVRAARTGQGLKDVRPAACAAADLVGAALVNLSGGEWPRPEWGGFC